MKWNLVKRSGLGLLVASCWWLGTAETQAQQFGFPGVGQTTTRRTTSANYPSRTSVGQATFQYDPETRRVIAVTDEETAQYVGQVVSNLDRPAPQVLIKVVFLEATYSKGLDLGVEGGVQRDVKNGALGAASQAFGISGLANAATGAVANIFGQPISGFAPVPPGAGLYTILAQDYQATLRAIAQAGRTEILSRPSILARNNQQATISLGQQVPLITGTRFDTYGNQINTIGYQTVGIQLVVTPFITSDGMVEMIVTPTTSELADKSQWVTTSSGPGGSILSPVINSRSADTVVVVPDGQTVIIGGLMEKQNLRADSKIPILGDIPLLGMAFRHRVDSHTKTELLIFLTPHIVMHPSELAALSAAERANVSASTKTFSEDDLNRFLDSLPAKDKVPAQKTQK
jgi:general secretion pathway protein D